MSPPRTKNAGAMSVLGVLRMLEKHILKYKPGGEMGKELEWILEVTRTVTGQLAGGQENHQGGRMSVFDPQDWWNGLGLGLVRYYLDS